MRIAGGIELVPTVVLPGNVLADVSVSCLRGDGHSCLGEEKLESRARRPVFAMILVMYGEFRPDSGEAS